MTLRNESFGAGLTARAAPRIAGALAAAALAAACNGSIGPGDPTARGDAAADGALGPPGDPVGGPALIRRLTNTEYAQSLSDLLGEPLASFASANLPDDARVHGFDNNATAQVFAPVMAERYFEAAQAIATRVMASPTRRAGLLGCDPAADRAGCLRAFVTSFGRRIYRRPLAQDEVDALVALAMGAASATPQDGGASLALSAMMQSPNFLFRVEVGTPDPAHPGASRLSGYELATRLSYFLWGSTPSRSLLDAAERGALDSPEGVRAIATQMLADPKARPAMHRFASEWLQLDQMPQIARDAMLFPTWSAAVGASMVEETSRLVDDLVWRDGANFLDLVTARYTFVDATLAGLYGLPAPPAGSWARVDLPAGAPRQGLLTHASVLTLTAHVDVTSPTLRGQYVRSVLLCQELPPPPPGVSNMPPAARPGETARQQFARHTTDPSCAGCHTRMDPIGWGLEQFDAIGRQRTTDSNGRPLDLAGYISGLDTPDFTGPVELSARVGASPELSRCVATQLFRYALGRTETDQDAPAIGHYTSDFRASGQSFRALVLSVVTSDAFRYVRPADAGATNGGGM